MRLDTRTRLLVLTVGFVLPLGREARADDIQAGKLPAVVDLRKDQTGIRNQGALDYCPYFPVVGALEAANHRLGDKVDLSVRHLVWLRNVTRLNEHQPPTRDQAENLVSTLGGGGLGESFQVLGKYGVCREQDLPYVGSGAVGNLGSAYYKGFDLEKYAWSTPFSQTTLNRWNLDPRQLPKQARANANHGIERYVLLPKKDLRNPRKFEEILAAGHEIVWSLLLHDDIHQLDPTQPVWRRKPGSKPNSIFHLTMIVGYDRERKFFIVKNSWGPTNYSANKKNLAPGWQDIVKYDGYTLVDYHYLAECHEAGYIAEVAAAASPRFVAQRALGQWRVTFAHKGKDLMTGVLSWRHMPLTAALPRQDLRIGELLTKDGQQFRVNAKLAGDGSKPYKLTLYVDFSTGILPYDSTGGTAWSGAMTLPEKGNGTWSVGASAAGKTVLWGASAAEVRITAVQVDEQNLLSLAS